MDTGFAWGWMRIHCHFVHRLLPTAVWGKMPHVGLGIACTVVAGALPLRPAGVPLPPVPVAAPIAPSDTMFAYLPAQGIGYAGGYQGAGGQGIGHAVGVPEPSSIVVFLAGLAALVLLQRRS